MRTTLDLDEDLILVAKQLMEQRRSTMGQVVSQLMRKALEPRGSRRIRNGVPLFTPVPDAPCCRSRLLTSCATKNDRIG